ncbi:hypothetical protein [Herbihabitans rhizosphaerae]|nr:hypothetical protein [Herbihabitans rhizosphaerae]
MGDAAPRLRPGTPLRQQIDNAVEDHDPDRYSSVSGLVTSAAGRSLGLLRGLFYRLLNLTEPSAEAPVEVVPSPSTPRTHRWDSPHAYRVSATVDEARRTITVVRRPAEVGLTRAGRPATHIVCSRDYPLRSLRSQASVITARRPDLADPPSWLRATLDHNPTCQVAALLDQGICTVRTSDGWTATLRAAELPEESLPSVIVAWLAAGHPITELPPSITIEIGARRGEVTVDRAY